MVYTHDLAGEQETLVHFRCHHVHELAAELPRCLHAIGTLGVLFGCPIHELLVNKLLMDLSLDTHRWRALPSSLRPSPKYRKR